MVVGTSIYKVQEEDKQKLTDCVDYDLPVYAPHVITRETQRSRLLLRLFYISIVLLLGVFLVASGIYIYKQHTAARRGFDGWCSVHYPQFESTGGGVGHLIDHGGLHADDLLDKPVFSPREQDLQDSESRGEFMEHVNLNLTNDFEQIEVPEISIYKKASFLHDFSSNWSVIHDLNANRCFILALDRNKIAPPRNMLDMIMKSMTGYYLPDNSLVQEQMIVQTPALDDLTQFGTNIAYKCKDSQSFLLKKRSIEKRSLKREKRCEFASDFIHSVGKSTLAYHLTC